MSTIQAFVRYTTGEDFEVFDYARDVANIPNISQVEKIMFYNEAKFHVENTFKNVPGVMFSEKREYLTHVGETARFIVYNW